MKAQEVKEIAKTLYITLGLSQAEIAKRLNKNKAQISRWVSAGDWAVLRSSKVATRDQIIQRTYIQITKIYDLAEQEERTLTVSESDQIAKLMSGVKSIHKEADLSSYIQTFEEFLIYLRQENFELAKEISDYQMDFLTIKARQLSQ